MNSTQRTSKVLLVAMMGMALVFGPGCTAKKKKARAAAELPADRNDTTGDDRRADASSADSSAGQSASADSSDTRSRSDSLSSSSSGDTFGGAPADSRDGGLTPASGGTLSSAGGAGSFEGLEGSRHAAATVGDDPGGAGLIDSKPAIADEFEPAQVAPKSKRGKKGNKKRSKKARAAAAVSADEAIPEVADAGGAGDGFYIVQKGDTISKIAKSYGVSQGKLLKMNAMTLTDAPKLQVGARLKIPGKA
jgi:LysM repeat protein